MYRMEDGLCRELVDQCVGDVFVDNEAPRPAQDLEHVSARFRVCLHHFWCVDFGRLLGYTDCSRLEGQSLLGELKRTFIDADQGPGRSRNSDAVATSRNSWRHITDGIEDTFQMANSILAGERKRTFIDADQGPCRSRNLQGTQNAVATSRNSYLPLLSWWAWGLRLQSDHLLLSFDCSGGDDRFMFNGDNGGYDWFLFGGDVVAVGGGVVGGGVVDSGGDLSEDLQVVATVDLQPLLRHHLNETKGTTSRVINSQFEVSSTIQTYTEHYSPSAWNQGNHTWTQQ